jgi:REP element-mobilizing transposase RayT
MSHTYTKLLVHCVFSTKERRAAINDAVRERLYAYIDGIIRERNSGLVAVGGTEDHVHLLIDLPAVLAVADAMRFVKANSSKWVRTTFPTHSSFGWQTGYGAFSVSASVRDDVVGYIKRQDEHHRTRGFKEEFVALLARYGVEHDERYLWD